MAWNHVRHNNYNTIKALMVLDSRSKVTRNKMITAAEVLEKATVNGLVVKLPEIQLERSVYLEVKKALEKIGGKWKGGKISGFVFPFDPTDLMRRIADGENVNIKKDFQFFATPDDLADRLIEIANISRLDTFLEPQGGNGAIIRAIRRKLPIVKIDTYELMEQNQQILKKIPAVNLLGENFLLADEAKKYSRIICNPPFRNHQDVDSFYKAWNCLADDGKLVSIMSKSWQHQDTSKAISFRGFLNDISSEVIEVPAGAFKESGTNIATVIVVADKID